MQVRRKVSPCRAGTGKHPLFTEPFQVSIRLTGVCGLEEPIAIM